ncbi:MAG: MFS transporter [Planctomycetota bacterium]
MPDAGTLPAASPDARAQRAWCLYDFGNSGFAVLFPVVFGTWYATRVVGGNAGDAAWGRLVATSMLVVAALGPFLGGIADHAGVRKRLFVLFTLLGGASVLGFSGLGTGDVALGFVLGVLANVGFEGAIVFYNAYLPRLVPPAEQGVLSARAFAWGYVGSLVALGVAVPLLKSGWLLGVWVALTLQWWLAAWPSWRDLPADRATGMGVLRAARVGAAGTWRTFRDQVLGRPVGRFLLAYFFFMDGVLTVISFASLFAKRTLAFTDAELIGLIAGVQVTALIGAAVIARLARRHEPDTLLRALLVLWLAVVGATWFATTKGAFLVVAGFAGLGLGSIQSTARAAMARRIPEGQEAELFGFYALCGKSGAILGPLLFGALSEALDDQRPAVLALGTFFLLGLAILTGSRRAPR